MLVSKSSPVFAFIAVCALGCSHGDDGASARDNTAALGTGPKAASKLSVFARIQKEGPMSFSGGGSARHLGMPGPAEGDFTMTATIFPVGKAGVLVLDEELDFGK